MDRFTKTTGAHAAVNAAARERRLNAALVVVALLATAAGLWLLVRPRAHERLLRSALAAIQQPDEQRDAATTLARWERSVGAVTPAARAAMIAYLMRGDRLESPAARRVLAHLGNVDFRDRTDDWRRWYENLRRLSAHEPPTAPRADRVRLSEPWNVPVGLTAPASNLLPIGGALFVPSLGSAAGVADGFDGLVRVDPQQEQALLLDTAGAAAEPFALAAGARSLFLAQPDGALRRLTPTGSAIWDRTLPAVPVSWPLVLDTAARDRPASTAAAQVVIVTADDRVRAFAVDSGAPRWTAALPNDATAPRLHPFAAPLRPAPRRAFLALLDFGPADKPRPTILATAVSGALAILDADDGRALFEHALGAAVVASPITRAARENQTLRAVVGDAAGRIWGIYATANQVGVHLITALPELPENAIVAVVPRETGDARDPLELFVVTRGARDGPGGAVLRYRGDELVWRASAGGIVTTPPVIADLNGDRRPEVAVAAVRRGRTGPRGVISVFSPSGHLVWRQALPASAASGPVAGDIDRDGDLDLLVTDRAGSLHCWSADAFGPVDWALPAGDPQNSCSADRAYAWNQRLERASWLPGDEAGAPDDAAAEREATAEPSASDASPANPDAP